MSSKVSRFKRTRDERRRALGLEPGRPTGVVMFGGQGSRQMLSIAKALDDVPLVLLCGHNGALATRLRAIRHARTTGRYSRSRKILAERLAAAQAVTDPIAA